MSNFDPSPRAAKRQKTTSNDSNLPFSSRVLRTVKQAVYGKTLSTPISHVFNKTKLVQGGEDVPRKVVRNTPRRKSNGKDAPRKDIEQKNAASHQVIDPILQQDANDGRDELDEELRGTPSKKIPSGHRKAIESSQKKLEATEPSDMSAIKKRRRYKGWVEIEEPDELQGDDGPSEAEQLHNDLGEAHLSLGKDLPEAVRRAKKRAKELEIDMRDHPGTDTPSGKLRRKSGQPSDEDGSIAEAVPIKKRTSRQKIAQRKQLPETATVVGNYEDEGNHLGFGKIPTRDVSVDDLAQGGQTDQLDHTTSIDTPSSKPERKRKEGPYSIANGGSSLSSMSLVPELRGSSKEKGTKIHSDHVKPLQELLHKEPEIFTVLQTRLLENLTGKRRLPLVNLEDEYRKVHQLVEQTVLAGEGNSMLVIGSRGSGKTTLVETAISDLASDHRNEFHVVRLNGFIHTDDKLALREIWRQLGREMEIEDDVMGGRSNYADTLTSLLALLSHSPQETEVDDAATAPIRHLHTRRI